MAKAHATTVNRVGLTEARNGLGQIVRRVYKNNEIFILEKDGIPVAGLMGVEDLEDYLELNDPETQAHIKESHEDYLAGRVRPAMKIVHELRREVPAKAKRKIKKIA